MLAVIVVHVAVADVSGRSRKDGDTWQHAFNQRLTAAF
jgi:hypothetical protein